MNLKSKFYGTYKKYLKTLQFTQNPTSYLRQPYFDTTKTKTLPYFKKGKIKTKSLSFYSITK